MKIFNYILVFFFLLNGSQLYAKISNSILITVGNLPITYLDLVKEMTFISIISDNKIDEENKEQIKNLAAKALVKRKIKEIEIEKYKINDFNKKDLEMLTANILTRLKTNKEGMKKILQMNNLTYKDLEKRFEIDLKWNTLIFELYKNRVVLNMSEVEEKIKTELEKIDSKKSILLSEIEVGLPEGNYMDLSKKILDNIKKEGFEKTAKKFSISTTSEIGGNLGWIDEEKLSKTIYNKIKNLKVNEISEPIVLDNTMLIIKKNGEKVFDKNIEKVKNYIIRIEKEKKLKMFSNSHYSNLERSTQINFL